MKSASSFELRAPSLASSGQLRTGGIGQRALKLGDQLGAGSGKLEAAAVLAAAVAIWAASGALAQDVQQDGEPRLHLDFAQSEKRDGEYITFGRGAAIDPFKVRVRDRIAEMGFRADRIIAWTTTPGTGAGTLTGFRRFYAEGNVVFFRRDILSQAIEMFRVEQFYIDLDTHTGYFLDVRADQRPGDVTQPAVTVRASEARLAAGGLGAGPDAARSVALGLPGMGQMPPGRVVAFDVVMSTCMYGDPHYHVGLSQAKVDWKWDPDPKNPFSFVLGRPSLRGFGGEWLTLNIWGIPVFAWPSFYLEVAALSALPLERVQGGRTSRFGVSVETTWGIAISKGFIDALNPFDDDSADDDRQKYGRLRWEIDWRQNRGWAFGIDPSWKWSGYSGYLDTYYLRDEGPDPNNDFDRRFLPLERQDRGRARLFHRVELTDHLRGEIEVSWLSDRNVLEEFFEKEFKEGKEQESVAYLRYLDGHIGGFLMARGRINDFQTQVEYLPKAKGFLADEPILTGLPFGWAFREELEVAHLRQLFDEALDQPSEKTWRIDSLSSWSLAVPLGVATLSPFAEARVTAWERALDGDPADRFLATAGVRAATDIWGDHDVDSEFLGLHRLRHIIHLEARAVTAFANTLEASELFPYDAVDGLDKFTEYSFEVRNRFQTKVIDGQEFRKRDWLSIGGEIEYYPDAERDTVGFKASNFSYPFNWITLGPHDASKALDERNWSNLHWDLMFTPTNSLEARGVGEYNPVNHQEEVREYTVTVRPREGLSLSVGQVFVFDVTNAFTIGAKWDLTEKWRVTADAQYDYKTNDFINRKATVGRDFHDFRFEAVFEEDTGRDERRFYVTFVPTFLRIAK